MTYVLDLEEQHTIFADFRTDKSFYQALAIAHHTAYERASSALKKDEAGKMEQLQDHFRSNLHIIPPERKEDEEDDRH